MEPHHASVGTRSPALVVPSANASTKRTISIVQKEDTFLEMGEMEGILSELSVVLDQETASCSRSEGYDDDEGSAFHSTVSFVSDNGDTRIDAFEDDEQSFHSAFSFLYFHEEHSDQVEHPPNPSQDEICETLLEDGAVDICASLCDESDPNVNGPLFSKEEEIQDKAIGLLSTDYAHGIDNKSPEPDISIIRDGQEKKADPHHQPRSQKFSPETSTPPSRVKELDNEERSSLTPEEDSGFDSRQTLPHDTSLPHNISVPQLETAGLVEQKEDFPVYSNDTDSPFVENDSLNHQPQNMFLLTVESTPPDNTSTSCLPSHRQKQESIMNTLALSAEDMTIGDSRRRSIFGNVWKHKKHDCPSTYVRQCDREEPHQDPKLLSQRQEVEIDLEKEVQRESGTRIRSKRRNIFTSQCYSQPAAKEFIFDMEDEYYRRQASKSSSSLRHCRFSGDFRRSVSDSALKRAVSFSKDLEAVQEFETPIEQWAESNWSEFFF